MILNVLKSLLLISILFLFTKCNKVDKEVMTYEYIKSHIGKEITITGIYKKAYLNQNPANKEFQGYYEIQINDSLSVLLEAPYDAKAKRLDGEVQELEGKKVKATGVIYDKTYTERPTIETVALSLSIPCLREIKKIEKE